MINVVQGHGGAPVVRKWPWQRAGILRRDQDIIDRIAKPVANRTLAAVKGGAKDV